MNDPEFRDLLYALAAYAPRVSLADALAFVRGLESAAEAPPDVVETDRRDGR